MRTLLDMVKEYQALLERKDELATLTKENTAAIEAAKLEITQQMIDDDCPRISTGGYTFTLQSKTAYANSAEKNYQKQYDYYKNGNSKVKNQHTSTGSACFWWLRSVYATNTTYFCLVYTGGGADYYLAYISYGFAPGFKAA